MKTLQQYLAVGGAGFLGAIARLFVARVSMRWIPSTFPVGTLVVNLTGCFILAWFYAAISSRWEVSETTRLAFGAGFVGAYTTFSTFAYESDALIQNRAYTLAAINLVGSVVLGLIAVRLGVLIGGAR